MAMLRWALMFLLISLVAGGLGFTGISAGHIGPDLTHFASRKTFAGSLMATTPDNLTKWIENPEHMKPGALMPNLAMKGEQSKALAAYLLSLK